MQPKAALPSCSPRLQDTRRVQSCPLDGSAEAPALAAALMWRQKQFADFLGGQEVQVRAPFEAQRTCFGTSTSSLSTVLAPLPMHVWTKHSCP